MLTNEERQELDGLRVVAGRTPILERLIELERKDAADPTPIVDCCQRLATECECSAEKRTQLWRDWYKSVSSPPSPDFDDEPTKERKTFAGLAEVSSKELDQESKALLYGNLDSLYAGTEKERNPGGESEPEWRREMDRIYQDFFSEPQSLEIFRGFDSDNAPLNSMGDDVPPYRLLWVDHTEADKKRLRDLWPFEQLRRVVLAGQGEIQIPKAVAKHLPVEGDPHESHYPAGTCVRHKDLWLLEVKSPNLSHAYWLNDGEVLAAIDTAANEVLHA